MQKTPITQVYIMYSEIPNVHDKMNIKIGISLEPEDRRKSLQTSNPFPVHIINTFDAGRDAQKHEKHFHDLYQDYHTSGEWFVFESIQFEEVILPQMMEYFSKIDVIEGEALPLTKLTLSELNEGIDNITYKSKYMDKKLALIKLQKALTIVEDNKKAKYQRKIDIIQKMIDNERKELQRISLEKLAVKVMKRQANAAKQKLQHFALGYLVGCASA